MLAQVDNSHILSDSRDIGRFTLSHSSKDMTSVRCDYVASEVWQLRKWVFAE